MNEVGFDDLGRVIETLIDDGSWRRIKVEVLSPAKQVKRARAPA